MTITLDDLISAREAEIEALREAARRNEELVSEMEEMSLEHAREIRAVKRDWWKGRVGLWLFEENSAQLVSEDVEWSPAQLQAWLRTAPAIHTIAGMLISSAEKSQVDRAEEVVHLIVRKLGGEP